MENRLSTVSFQSLGKVQILNMSLSSDGVRNSSQVLCEPASHNCFSKVLGKRRLWSFKGRLGCSASSAKVQSRFSVSREHALCMYTPLKCARVCVCTPMTSARRDHETCDRDREPFQSGASNLRESLLSDRKENSTSLLQFKMQSASDRFAL